MVGEGGYRGMREHATGCHCLIGSLREANGDWCLTPFPGDQNAVKLRLLSPEALQMVLGSSDILSQTIDTNSERKQQGRPL